MGKALELVTARATQPNTGAAFAALVGNSLTVRNAPLPAVMLAAWQTRQVAGFTRITSPLLHDGTVGIQCVGPIGTAMFPRMLQVLEPQDTLSVVGSGSNVAGDMEFFSMLLFYPNLPGADARLITATELRRRTVDYLSVPNTIATGTTGEYTTAEAVNVEANQFKANTDYAILGASVQLGSHALRWLGPDFGGLGVGIPGKTLMERPDFFVWLAEETGLPVIPVINSANAGMTFVDAVVDENGADPVICTAYARLR